MKWRKRSNVRNGKQQGEEKSADRNAAELWLKEFLPTLLMRFTPDCSYNTDETGLFYRGTATKGLMTKDEKGHKH